MPHDDGDWNVYKTLLFAFLILFAGATAAEDRDTRVDVNGEFAMQRQKIVTALDDGKSYSEINRADREKVLAALARIGTALQHAGGVEGLSKDQKIAVFNDQELANAILTKAGEDSRLICKREMKTGSHRATTQCLTVAERDRAREHAQRELGKMPPHQMKDPMGGG